MRKPWNFCQKEAVLGRGGGGGPVPTCKNVMLTFFVVVSCFVFFCFLALNLVISKETNFLGMVPRIEHAR